MADRSRSKKDQDLDPDYEEANLDLPRLYRQLTVKLPDQAGGLTTLTLTIPPELKYDGVWEQSGGLQPEGVGGSTQQYKSSLTLAFLKETQSGTYYPIHITATGYGKDVVAAKEQLAKNMEFVIRAKVWEDEGEALDLDNDGTYEVVRAGDDYRYPLYAEYELPEIPWNLSYVPNAKISADNWAQQSNNSLSSEIRSGVHTNQFGEVGCPVCGSINEFWKVSGDTGSRYTCMDCFYASGDFYVIIKSRGDKTLSDYGMKIFCEFCQKDIEGLKTRGDLKKHIKSHEKLDSYQTENDDEKLFFSEIVTSVWESQWPEIYEFIEHGMAGDGLMHYWDDADRPEDQTIQEYLDEKFVAFQERFLENIEVDDDRILAYRLLYTPVGTPLNTKNLGQWETRAGDKEGIEGERITSWMWTPEGFYPAMVFGYEGIDHMEGIEGINFDRIVISGYVGYEDIDWPTTIAYNISTYEQENELCVIDGAEVEELEWFRNGKPDGTLEVGFATEAGGVAHPKTRMTRTEADKIIKGIEKKLTPWVTRMEVCGSYRRGRQDPGDLDIILIPAPGLSLPELIKNKLKIPESKIHWLGEKKAQVDIKGYNIDFRTSSPDGWGAALLYFTGPSGYNIGMRVRAKKMGFKLNEYGVFNRTTGDYLGGKTEDEVYKLLNKTPKLPELRAEQYIFPNQQSGVGVGKVERKKKK